MEKWVQLEEQWVLILGELVMAVLTDLAESNTDALSNFVGHEKKCWGI